MFAALEVEVDFAHGRFGESAGGGHFKVDDTSVGRAHRHDIAACLAHCHLVDGHVVILERSHGGFPTGGGVAAGQGVGVELDGD